MRLGIFGLSEFRKEQLEGNVSKVNRENYREFGYFSSFTALERLDYSNDTQTVSQKASLTTNKFQSGTVGNNNYGYFAGGNGPSVSLSAVDRLDYFNDTAATLVRGSLSGPKQNLAGAGNNNYGYIAGGVDTSVTPNVLRSVVDRITYSNDTITASIRGPLAQARSQFSGVGNMTYAWFAGGSSGPFASSIVDRIDYFNDTTTASTRTALPAARTRLSASGNQNFGYWVSGGLPVNTLVQRIDLSNDTSISTRGSLNTGRMLSSGTGNSNFGYFGGGYNSELSPIPYYSSIERIDYANDTPLATFRSSLRSENGTSSAVSSRNFGGANQSLLSSFYTFPKLSNKAYFASGGGGLQIYTIDFSNDTAKASARGSTVNNKNTCGTSANQNYGYFGGAYNGPAPFGRSHVDRLDFSNDNEITLVRGPLSLARYYPTGLGNINYGYFGGGIDGGSWFSTVDRIDYSTDTSTAVAKGPLYTTPYGSGSASAPYYGYFMGGDVLGGVSSSIARLDYANDTVTTAIRGVAASPNRIMGSSSNSVFGYFFGGYGVVGARSYVMRMNYSNDTNTAQFRGPLTSVRSYNHENGTGNPNFGYCAGGYSTSAPLSTVDRIDYSNDTVLASSRGPLPRATSGQNGISAFDFSGSSLYFDDPFPRAYKDENVKKVLDSYGYIAGGLTAAPAVIATIGRIDYSNDTQTETSRSQFFVAKQDVGGTGNTNYGYFGGGFNSVLSPVVYYSTIDRLDYTNDSVTTRSRGPLTTVRRSPSAVGTQTYGWFAGGAAPTVLTSIDRLDFSNDSATSLSRGLMTTSRYIFASTKTKSYGWFGGGFTTPPSSTKSTVDRIDFFNDSAVVVSRGPLSLARWKSGATGNENYGWFGGGGTPSPLGVFSTVDRIDYSNDSVTASARSPLNAARGYLEAVGTADYGWFCGGSDFSPAFYSRVDRIDFANDTVTPSIRGNLSSSKNKIATSTNA